MQGELSIEHKKALELHYTIMQSAETVAGALLQMCKSLKEMRDTKLYLQLDMTSFEDYCENKVGIKSRQAYNYIKVYEQLGSTVLQSNAKLGITKLDLISQLPAVERTEKLADGTFDGMSVKEIRKLVKESKNQAEQINLLTSEIMEVNTRNKSLEEQLEEAKNVQPVIIKTPDEEIEKIKADVEQQTKEKIEKANADKMKAFELQKAKDEQEIKRQKEELANESQSIEKKYSERLKQLEEEKCELKAKLENHNVSNTSKSAFDKAKALTHFESMQNSYNAMLSAIENMDKEQRDEFKKAVKSALLMLAENL